jgi:hypothetical protein
MLKPMNLRSISCALLLALSLGGGTRAQAGPAAPAPKRPVVVELYTSQGCSSCLPADALLAKLTKRGDILPLSLSITYWDMLGWKDTLASENNTRRQEAYAAQMGHSAVYTPQMIVDGITDVVGSREAQVLSAIDARAHDGDADDVPVAVNETKSELHIGIGASADRGAPPATVWMFHLRGQATVAIGGGENDGRTMTYHNVVGDLRAVGQWKGEKLSIDLPRAAMEGLPHDAVAIVVQRGGYGHVVGAAMLSHPDFYPEQ